MRRLPPMDRDAQRDRRDDVLRLSRSGLTGGQIADEIGIHRATVVRIRKELGLSSLAPRRLTSEEIARASALLADGAPQIEVARTLRRSPRSIQRHFPGTGWTVEQTSEHNSARMAIDPGNRSRAVFGRAFLRHITSREATR